MKTKLLGITAVIGCLLTGCTSLPTVEQMEKTAYTVGVTTGYVANETKMSNDTKNAVINIIGEVAKCTPDTNETFTVAWTPIATAYANKLLEEGKIDEGQKTLILGAFKVACTGLDYLFDVRYPKAREYTELVSAAVKGFSEGFLNVFKPADEVLQATKEPPAKDEELYKYLKARLAE